MIFSAYYLLIFSKMYHPIFFVFVKRGVKVIWSDLSTQSFGTLQRYLRVMVPKVEQMAQMFLKKQAQAIAISLV